MAAIDLTGRQFGRLTALERVSNKSNRVQWECLCSCGKRHTTYAKTLLNGRTKSCGCLYSKSKSHGKSKTLVHRIWCGIKSRCLNPNSTGYKNYGGRGIKLDPTWLEFENFYKDMGECPPGFSIERLNTNGNYTKSNCIWLERNKQSINQRRSLKFELKDEVFTLKELATLYGINYHTLYNRLFIYNIELNEALVYGKNKTT